MNKKCEHCLKDCSKRIAVKHNGKVLMVGTACSKKFKKAKIKDLLRDASLTDSIAKRTMSHGGDPSRYSVSKEDFFKRFPKAFDEISSTWSPLEFYNWTGRPVVLFKSGDKLALFTKDPYSNVIQQGVLIYEDVSKAKTPGRKLSVSPGYEYNVLGIKNPPKDIDDADSGKILEWVDEFTAWDPIKKFNGESIHIGGRSASYFYLGAKVSAPSSSFSGFVTVSNQKFDTSNLTNYIIENYLFDKCEIESTSGKNYSFNNCHFKSCKKIELVNSEIVSFDTKSEMESIPLENFDETLFEDPRSYISSCKNILLKSGSVIRYSKISESVIKQSNDSAIRDCLLEECDFEGDYSFEIDISGCALRNARFKGRFYRSRFGNTGYSESSFIYSTLTNCTFVGKSNFGKPKSIPTSGNYPIALNFHKCTLIKVRFLLFDFSGINFSECTFEDCSFDDKCEFVEDSFNIIDSHLIKTRLPRNWFIGSNGKVIK